MNNMIRFDNVKLNIKSIDILNGISFDIKENSVTCFVGNKNVGKSTILKILSGIYKDYTGKVTIDGIDIKNNVNKKIELIHDKKEFNTDLNVMEYLGFYCTLSNRSFDEVEIIAEELLKKYSLISYKYTSIDMLDVETYKLIDLIRVSINNADIVLFDNLFSSDSLEFNEKMLEIIKNLYGNKTLIFASRNLKYIDKICEYLGVIDAGNLLIFDEIDNVFKKAELNRKVEVKLYDGLQEAINLLYDDKNVTNIMYDNNKILFSLDGDEEVANDILQKLVKNDIKVYSFQKETATFEQLFSKLKD